MRLIDADKLNFSFDRRVFGEVDENYIRGADDAISVVNNAKTVEDVAPVSHGKWVGKPIAGYCNIRCSECGEIYYNNGKWKYCPNCGARMDG